MNLTQLFAKAGTITNLRVPTNKNGDERKPYCYIEYQTEEQARLAVEKFDGYEFFKNKIRVAISAPPKREGGKLTKKQEMKKKQQQQVDDKKSKSKEENSDLSKPAVRKTNPIMFMPRS